MWWTVAWAVSIALVLLFSLVILVGAPFLPTLKKHVEPALDLLDLNSGQTLLELGSGDGRVLIAAAKRGIYAVGYELNPLLVVYSWLVTRKYRKHVRIIWGNYWEKPWPSADGIFVFLLQPYMEKLDKKIIQYMLDLRKPSDLDLSSSMFDMPLFSNGSEPSGSLREEKKADRHTGGKDITGSLGESSTHKPVKLVSFAFEIKSRKPIETKDGLFLYIYT